VGDAERAKKYRELALELLLAARCMEKESQRLAMIGMAAAYRDLAEQNEQSANADSHGDVESNDDETPV
jgi:hypothetical protein